MGKQVKTCLSKTMATNNINAKINYTEEELLEMGYEDEHSWGVNQSLKMDPNKYVGKGVVRVNTLSDGTVLRNISFMVLATGKRKSFKVSKYSPVQPEQGDEIEISRCSIQHCTDEIDGSTTVNVSIAKA